jgi:hypothetical protein
MSVTAQGIEDKTKTDTETNTSPSLSTVQKESPSDSIIEKPQELLNAFERQKQENKDLKETLKGLTDKLSAIEGTLGSIDESTAKQIQKQIEEAERTKREAEEFRQKLIAQTEAELEAKYKPQVSKLEQTNIILSNSLEALFKQQALQESFARNNGVDFPSFSALVAGTLKPVYVDYEDPTSPTGKRVKVMRFTNMDETPITDESGRELSLGEIYKSANTGKWGAPLKATFSEFNQAQGDGFYQGGIGSDIINPWTDKHFNLTNQGKIYKENPALARQMAAQAGKKLV